MYRSKGLHGYSVKHSPFAPQRLAFVANQHFGIAGCGELQILDVLPNGSVACVDRLEWPDGLFDVAWSEEHEAHLVTSSGDGTLQLWDLGLRPRVQGPVRHYREHTKEIYTVDWSLTRGEPFFVSGSWDTTCKLWDPASLGSVATFAEHTGVVYCVVMAPRRPAAFASVGADGSLKIWDWRAGQRSAQSIHAHDYEVLACDWSKYDEHLVVTGSVDKTLRAFDLRMGRPVNTMAGHEYGVRRLRCSPHTASIVASCSYDFTVRVWDTTLPPGLQQVALFDDHTEFVVGLDFNLHTPGQLTDCAWDERVMVRQL